MTSIRFSIAVRRLAVTAVAAVAAPFACAQVSDLAITSSAELDKLPAMATVRAIIADKQQRTSAQKKLNTDLLFAGKAARGQRVPALRGVYDDATARAGVDAAGMVTVDVKGGITEALKGRVLALGGTIVNAHPEYGALRAQMPIAAVETLAEDAGVKQVVTAERLQLNVGSLTTQGYISHKANVAGFTGAGVKVGVLSNSASAARVAALMASGDLGPGTTVLEASTGTDEGTAMMEIVQDLAPGAQIYFATANGGQAHMAANIAALAAAGCTIIVDDVSYFAEGAFQDGPIAQAVNTFTAAGGLYFSSSANSGNVTSGTSGTWERDFLDAGAITGPIASAGETGRVHNFGTAGSPVLFNTLTGSSTLVTLKWSDPLGASTNDYDLFVLNGAGTTLTAFSAGVQDGTQDPYEQISVSAGIAIGSRLVVVKFSGADRALRLDTNRGQLSLNTNGSTYGHNAGASTVTVAAVSWNAAKTGVKPFVGGAANPTETFSSDGPRKMFFNPDGTPITPGNLLFATNGGMTLAKPDIAAADGVTTKTPGFNPFYGTSAAAPHAAAIAAIVKSAKPGITNTQILTAMKATALDIRAPGVDVDSGVGLVMAKEAVDYALTH